MHVGLQQAGSFLKKVTVPAIPGIVIDALGKISINA